MEEVIQHPFFSRYQTKLPENLTSPSLDMIYINGTIGMQKVLFDIEPVRPPKNLKPQVVKIDAIVCPENYSFSSDLRSASCPSWRYDIIHENNPINDHIGKSISTNSHVFI